MSLDGFLPRCAAGEWTPAFALVDAAPPFATPVIAVRDESDGWTLKGAVAATIVGGRAVFVNPDFGIEF